MGKTAARKCWIPDCDDDAESVEPAHGYCRGDLDKVLNKLEGHVVKLRDVAGWIYVGRSHHPERRLVQHVFEHDDDIRRDHMRVVHWASSHAEAKHLETALIRRCKQRKFERVENDSDESSGSIKSPWNAIYLLFSIKHGRLPDRATELVRDLCLRNRILPTHGLLEKPMDLRTELTASEARAEEKRFYRPQEVADKRGDRRHARRLTWRGEHRGRREAGPRRRD